MKRAKRFLVFCLSCALALSTATLLPITANAEGTLADVDTSGGFHLSETPRIEITDAEQTYTFTSTTNANASKIWETPIFFVYSGNDEIFGGRSDVYGWMPGGNTGGPLPAGYNYQTNNAPTDDAAWATWLDVNKAGAECKITMRKVGNYAIVAFSNNGVSSIATIPTSDTAYVTLSGENCKLTNITSSADHLDLTSAIDQLPEDGGNDNNTNGTFDLVDTSTGFRKTESPKIPLTATDQTYTFTSTTNADAPGNYCTPSFFVYSEGGAELFAGRSDVWGWALNDFSGADINNLPEGYAYQTSNVPLDDAAWATWLNANKAGVVCKITMRQVGNYAVVALSNNGVNSVATIPVSGTPSVTLSGENCILTNIAPSEDHIDLSAAVDLIPSDPGTDEPGTDEPGTDEPGTDEPGTDTPGGVFLDCDAFWSAHTEGFEITGEPHTYKFHSKTDDGALNNWETPLFVAFHSEDGLVNGAGYREYGVIRSDNWYWDGAGMVAPICKATEAAIPGDDAAWAAWQAANRNGVECIVTTQLYKDCALIGVSNNGLTTTYAVPVDQAVKNYVSLTGELCTLSDLQTVDQHIDLSGAKAKADNRNNPPSNSNDNSSAPAAPPAEVRAVAGGEILSGSAWWSGMAIGSNQPMSGDGTWTWVVQASSLIDGYGAFSVEIYDPATNGYITTGSDMNAWTAEGFDPAKATVIGVPAELASNLVEGHAYVVTVTRSGNSFAVQYVDFAENREICTLVITPGELVSHDVQIHVMAQVGTYLTAFCEGTLIDSPASANKPATSGEVLKGTEWWAGMMKGTDRLMSGDGTWTWTVQASSLMDGYGAFSVEIFDPATNGYITTGSDKNAWTAEGFDPAKAVITGIPSQLDSKLVQGHTYAVTVTRSGNTFTVCYTDHTTGKELCTLVITPAEIVGKDVQIHVMAQVGTFATAFNAGTLIAALGDSVPAPLYAIALIGIAAILFGLKKRFVK